MLLPCTQANVVQANMLDSQTKPALLQLEVELADDDEHSIAGKLLSPWPLQPSQNPLITYLTTCAAPKAGPVRGGTHLPAAPVLQHLQFHTVHSTSQTGGV